jgi:hypothetical protein
VQKIGGDIVGGLTRELREFVRADDPPFESLRLEKRRVVHVLQPNGLSLQDSEIGNRVDYSAFEVVQRGSHTVLPDVFPDVIDFLPHFHGSSGATP